MQNFKEYIVKFTNRCVYLGVFIKAGLNEIFWHLLILFYWVKFLVETNMNRSYLAKIWLVFIAAVMLGYIAVKRRKKKASDRMK